MADVRVLRSRALVLAAIAALLSASSVVTAWFAHDGGRAGVDVGGDVTIDADTFWPEGEYSIASLSVRNGATLTVAGGSTLAVSGQVLVSEQSALVLEGKNIGTMVDGEWRGEGVTIAAANVTVEAGSVISADGQGYAAKAGPGTGVSDGGMHGGSGGGYGGIGGRAGDDFHDGGPAYGYALAPVDLGSGGGPTRTAAGSGGGAITLTVTDTLTLDGEITADGANAAPGNCFSAPGGGGGAGGSVFITTAVLAGAGTVSANGGIGADGGCFPGVGDDGGGGAGGRIAVYYKVDEGFTGFTTSSVNGAGGGGHFGAPGTLVFVDATTNALRVSQHLELPPDSSRSFGSVTVDDAATLTLGGGTILTVENDLLVTGNSSVIARGKNTAGQVGDRWEGVGVTIIAHNAHVAAGSTISADGLGYLGGLGPGAGGGGGAGGRIAVHYNIDAGFTGLTASTVAGGLGGHPGTPGTLLFISCAGDCNGDRRVTIEELVQMMKVTTDQTAVRACLAGDKNHDGGINVAEIVTAVDAALRGCPAG